MKGDQKIIIGVIAATILIFVGLLWVMNSSQTPQEVNQDLLIGLNPNEKGASAEDAKLTIVEFSDFQCPACMAAAPILEQFVADHEDEVRFIYRHFPLVSIHQNAFDAAVASEVAAAEGRFWEYHDLLFENQAEWGTVTDPAELFADYAEAVGLGREDFTEKVEQDTFKARVRGDLNLGNEVNLTSTPSLFYNGRLRSGVPSRADLEQYLEEAGN